MKKIDKHNHLFNPSGCISEGAFFGYLNHELNQKEIRAIETHLTECLFCNDAMEGYEMQKDKVKVQHDLIFIKKELNLPIEEKQASKKRDNKRFLLFTVSIAASFFLIISGYYLFQVLPTNLKKSDLALQKPVQKNEMPENTNPSNSISEITIEEKNGNKGIKEVKGDIKNVAQSELTPEYEKSTKSAQDNKYFEFRESLLETDGDEINATSSDITKVTENNSPTSGETVITQEQMGGNGVVVNEDAEYSGQINDITLALDQNNELKKETVPVETKVLAEEVVLIKNVRDKEKIVSGKKDQQVDRNKKEMQAVTVTGGVTSSRPTPTLNSAMADYNAGNYTQAQTQFEFLLAHDKSNYAALYYLAMCQYNKGEKESALNQLDKLINKKSNPFFEMALWQKARIAEESNDKKQAAEIYRVIIKNNGSMKNRAINKVDELEKQ